MLCGAVADSHTKHAPSIFPPDGASPEPSDAGVVLATLVALQMSTVRWKRAMRTLESICGGTDTAPTSAAMVPVSVGEFIPATAAVSKAAREIEDACERLQVHVLTFDRILFGDTVESAEELVVRGQVFVIATCLRYLRELLPSGTIHFHSMDPISALFREFPGGIEQVIRYTELELHRITSLWLHLRRGDARIPGGLTAPIIADYRRLHRAAVLAAQHEIHGLMDNKRLGSFLQAGVEHGQDPKLRTACARIAVVLQIRLDAEIRVRFRAPG